MHRPASRMETLFCRNMPRLTCVQLEPSKSLHFVNFSGCCKLKSISVQVNKKFLLDFYKISQVMIPYGP
jgi:hypothetical protein